MNLKNKYLIIILRSLFGLFMIFAAVAGYFGAKSIVSGNPMEGLSQEDIEATKILWKTGILHLVKLVELVGGLMLLFNFFPALAILAFAPLSIGFLVYNAMMSPQNIPLTIIIGLINIYFGYIYWDKYKQLFKK